MSGMEQFCSELSGICPGIQIRWEEPLRLHTSFRIGGPAQCMLFPKSEKELAAVLRLSKKWDIQPVIIGAGTNVLAPDEGLRGLVVCTRELSGDVRQLATDELEVDCGVPLSRAALFACQKGLSGLEFAQGIPGTTGGGIYMNAGAYGGEMQQVAVRTVFCRMDGTEETYTGEEQCFSYRTSVFTRLQGVIVRTVFHLQPEEPELIRERMQELAEKRRASQPLELPSAGSTFKRPVGGYAAALIDKAGLKGFSVGAAAVSEKHAGFVVNKGGATCSEVRQLIEIIQRRVYDNSGIRLEPEVRIL